MRTLLSVVNTFVSCSILQNLLRADDVLEIFGRFSVFYTFSVLAISSPNSLIYFVSCIKVRTKFIGTYNGEYYT